MSVAAARINEDDRERRSTKAAPTGSPFIGWEKHIEFDGRSAGGINIPGGLRMAVVADRGVTPAARTRAPGKAPAARPAPEPIGWDRNITFEGKSAGGINIPGGLRAPSPRRA